MLCDLRVDDAVDYELVAALPKGIDVVSDYARASIPWPGVYGRTRGGFTDAEAVTAPRPRASRFRRRLAAWNDYASRRPWYPGPEWLPLGRHSVDMPHALSAARRVLQQHPDCQAIMVNADPFAALLVGARLSRETRLPLISDLRDPWAPCELRRPERPAPQRWLVDRLERSVVEASARVVVNSDGALAAYRAHYADLNAERFVCLRNHADPALIGAGPGEEPPNDRLRLLFLGNLRRFVQGEVLLDALSRLVPAAPGVLPVELVVSGHITPEAQRRAERLGVSDRLRSHAFVPYTRIGGFMHGAHALVLLHHGSEGGPAAVQRIPAKLYDYLASDRPIIAVADNPEIAGLVSPMAGVEVVSPRDPAALAAVIERLRRAPPAGPVARALGELDSHAASRRLADWLDQAVADSGRSA